MSKFPNIPDFTLDAQSMSTALRALKESVEILAGQRQGASFGAPAVYVQEQEPVQERRGELKRGDLWIRESDRALHYWSGQFWRPIAAE